MAKVYPPEIITVQTLVTSQIKIPNYQRPYKWRIKNVDDLINDIITFSSNPPYRLGTIILHRSNDKLEIVDGQQRLLTLVLIVKAICESELMKECDSFSIPLLEEEFPNSITRENLIRNYQHILSRIKDFNLEIANFLLYECELIKISIDTIGEAFQFFDSQNSRGKPLNPHNLLKAYHLREMNGASTMEKMEAVKNWDNTDSGKLINLFGNNLYKIKKWSKGKSAMNFTTDEIDVFKGITLNQMKNYPYLKSYEMNNTFLKNYYKLDINNNPPLFPQQLDNVIVNGKRFFEFTDTTLEKIEVISNYKSAFWENLISDDTSNIIEYLRGHGGQHRKGDRYCKLLFENTILYYYSRFDSSFAPRKH